jgi:hypothetical protein
VVVPATFAPAAVLTVTARVLCVIALSKVAVIVASVATPIAWSTGVVVVTVTGETSTVVNDHEAGLAIATPESLLAFSVTVYFVDPCSAAAGAKVAVLEAASYVAAPVTAPPPESLSDHVIEPAATALAKTT